MRLRTDIAFYAPGGSVAVKARIDALDNLALGSDAAGRARRRRPRSSRRRAPSASSAPTARRSRRSASSPPGRMGSHWGLGMLANGGDCADCDSGDAADRIALHHAARRPHLRARLRLHRDRPASSPQQTGDTPSTSTPSADVRTVTFAFLRYKDELARERRRKAGKTTVEYGAYVSHRWQNERRPRDATCRTAQPVADHRARR